MSVFPKRVVNGDTVLVHCNVTIGGDCAGPVCPLLQVSVTMPDDTQKTLHEKHILCFPAEVCSDEQSSLCTEGQSRSFRKETPLLVVAEYLSGRHSKSHLANLLKNIQTGRHFYFPYYVAPGSPLGKYTVTCRLVLDGVERASLTAAEDCFFVEELLLRKITREEGQQHAIVYNPGPERVQAHVVASYTSGHGDGNSKGIVECSPHTETRIPIHSGTTYLFYCEERQCIPLRDGNGVSFIRNPLARAVERDGRFYVFLHGDEACTLSGSSADVWRKANGELRRVDLQDEERLVLDELLREGLLQELCLATREIGRC